MNEEGFFNHCCPKKYQFASIDLLDKQSESLKQFGREWAKDPYSLFIYGNVGSGKTRYAFALIREMFKRCPRVIWPRYYTSPGIDSMLHEAIMSGGDKYILDNLKKEDLLFVDDFGRETISDRTKRQFFEIIDYRFSQELPTIITSNLSLDEISHRGWEAIASRMSEWQEIKFSGRDLRKQPIIANGI